MSHRDRKPHCPECGDTNIIGNGDMKWSVKQQIWVVMEDDPEGFDCQECDEQFSEPDWEPA